MLALSDRKVLKGGVQHSRIVVFDRRKDKFYCHNIDWEIMMSKFAYFITHERIRMPPHLGVLPAANLKDLHPSYWMPYIYAGLYDLCYF